MIARRALVVLLALLAAVSAASPSTTPSAETSVLQSPPALDRADPPSRQIRSATSHARPNADQGPTDVQIALVVLDIRRIIDVEQTMIVDFAFDARWNDPRLARSGEEVGGVPRHLGLDELWHPQIQVVNAGRLFPQFPNRVTVDDAGNCAQLQRFVGTVTCPLDLHDFPFDRQALAVEIISTQHSPDDVRFISDERLSGRADTFTIIDWNVGAATSEVRPVRLRTEGMTMAGFRTTMPATRYANYYVFKVITPLVVIVAMSWSVFWIDPKQAGAQLGIAATSLLTLIAYRFLLGSLVPKVSYLTRLDIFIFGATLLVFAALVESLFTTGLEQREKETAARSVDRWSRVVAPVLLLCLLWHAFG